MVSDTFFSGDADLSFVRMVHLSVFSIASPVLSMVKASFRQLRVSMELSDIFEFHVIMFRGQCRQAPKLVVDLMCICQVRQTDMKRTSKEQAFTIHLTMCKTNCFCILTHGTVCLHFRTQEASSSSFVI